MKCYFYGIFYTIAIFNLPKDMAKHNDLGKLGEAVAADFLRSKGYEICSKNYRYLKGEIDIIAKKDHVLAIVEVKSRKTGFIESLSDSITPKKIQLLTLTADHYVQERNLDVEVRFDIITVVAHKGNFDVEHYQDAFYHF